MGGTLHTTAPLHELGYTGDDIWQVTTFIIVINRITLRKTRIVRPTSQPSRTDGHAHR